MSGKAIGVREFVSHEIENSAFRVVRQVLFGLNVAIVVTLAVEGGVFWGTIGMCLVMIYGIPADIILKYMMNQRDMGAPSETEVVEIPQNQLTLSQAS